MAFRRKHTSHLCHHQFFHSDTKAHSTTFFGNLLIALDEMSSSCNQITMKKIMLRLVASFILGAIVAVAAVQEEPRHRRSLRKTCKTRAPDGYQFHFNIDTSGFDIKRMEGADVQTLANACSKDESCKGFNNAGYLKYKIKREEDWRRDWTSNGSAPCFATYLKNNYHCNTKAPEGYRFHLNRDSDGHNIQQLSSSDDLAKVCTNDELCLGYNSAGYMKYKILDSDLWNQNWTDLGRFPCGGLFLKIKHKLSTIKEQAPVTVHISRPDCSKFDGQIEGYKFIPRKNFGGLNMAQPGVTRGSRFGDLEALSFDCDKSDRCKGFNTYGDLKWKVLPLQHKKWHIYNGFRECEGFYIKKQDSICSARAPPGYKFHLNVDSKGHDIRKIQNTIPRTLAKICSRTPNCKGFNSAGWLKHKIKETKQLEHNWKHRGFLQCGGLYVKGPKTKFPTKTPRKPKRPDCNKFNGQIEGYTFIPRKDFEGYAIQQNVERGTRLGDIAGLAKDCDKSDKCKGFNSFGDLKSKVWKASDADKWHLNKGFSECEGFYIKKPGRTTKDGWRRKCSTKAPPGYKFFLSQDSKGWDLKRVSTNPAKICSEDPNCKGYNSGGWLKYRIRSRRQWDGDFIEYKYPCGGLFLKIGGTKGRIDKKKLCGAETKSVPAGYEFHLNKDSVGYDIPNMWRMRGKDTETLSAACSEDPYCVGFNTAGWLKGKIKSTGKWRKNYTHDGKLPCAGLYVKKVAAEKPTWFRIQNPNTGLYLEAELGRCDAKENNVRVADYNSEHWGQLWRLGPNKSFENKMCTHRNLDLDWGKCEAGRNIKLWNKHAGNAQQFVFDGEKIINSFCGSRLALDVDRKTKSVKIAKSNNREPSQMWKRVENVKPVAKLLTKQMSFDIGPKNSPLFKGGYVRVNKFSDAWTPKYKLQEFHVKRSKANDLNKDGVTGREPQKFIQRVKNGGWQAAVMFGDPRAMRDEMYVRAIGVDDTAATGITTKKGYFKSYNVHACVTNNTFEIEIGDGGGRDRYWAVTSIVFTPVTNVKGNLVCRPTSGKEKRLPEKATKRHETRVPDDVLSDNETVMFFGHAKKPATTIDDGLIILNNDSEIDNDDDDDDDDDDDEIDLDDDVSAADASGIDELPRNTNGIGEDEDVTTDEYSSDSTDEVDDDVTIDDE